MEGVEDKPRKIITCPMCRTKVEWRLNKRHALWEDGKPHNCLTYLLKKVKDK